MEYTFSWLIENYIYYWHANGEALLSPDFATNDLEGTAWCLQLYPRGLSDKYKDSLSIYLCRRDDGPEPFPLKYEFSVLSANGETLKSLTCEYTFKGEISYGFHAFLKMEQIKNEKTTYFPGNNLRCRCRMWRDGENIHSVTQISAITRIGIEQIAFLHEVEGFSALEANQKKTIQIVSPSELGIDLSCSLYYTDGPCCQGKILTEILPCEADKILLKCKLSLLDESGKSVEYSEADSRSIETKRDLKILPLTLTRQEILNRSQKYLLDDKLSLSCECTFSTGIEYEKIVKTVHQKISVTSNQVNDNDTCAEKMYNSNNALDDLKEIYNDEFLTDMTIETKTKSFPVHKIILCARSTVFKAMMVNDMNEKNSNIIQVDDIEDDIVQEFLLFLYSDTIEALQWETAKKLYYAADKYAVEKLKVLCSSFLVDNLSATSASELLLFADTHTDSRLKKSVEDFIFKHERSVYGSEEWKNLSEINPKLVSKTMLLMNERKL